MDTKFCTNLLESHNIQELTSLLDETKLAEHGAQWCRDARVATVDG